VQLVIQGDLWRAVWTLPIYIFKAPDPMANLQSQRRNLNPSEIHGACFKSPKCSFQERD